MVENVVHENCRSLAVSLQIELTIPLIVDEPPKSQLLIFKFLTEPSGQTLKIFLGQYVISGPVRQSEIVANEDEHHILAVELEILLVGHFVKQVVEAHVVVKNG